MVGPRIRDLRMDRALTQEQLAQRAGLSESALVRIERGEARPRLSTIRKIADALSIDVGELTAELRGVLPLASEDEPSPLADLQRLDAADDPLAPLEARDALQRVAEDVLAGLEPHHPYLPEHLAALAHIARQTTGALAAQGRALADFLDAVRDELIERQETASLQEARTAVQELIAAARTPAVDWEAAYRAVCRCYAALLLWGEPLAFHDAVGVFLLQRAELTLADLTAGGEPRDGTAAQIRQAVTALGTVLSLFDLANGARMGVRGGTRENVGSNVQR
jgi:transcriptional regulator with XRE-family HTH domain